jgi:hypothetical protein
MYVFVHTYTEEAPCLIIKQTVCCSIHLALLRVRILGRKRGRLMQLILGAVTQLARLSTVTAKGVCLWLV